MQENVTILILAIIIITIIWVHWVYILKLFIKLLTGLIYNIKKLTGSYIIKALPITAIVRNDKERFIQYNLVNDNLLSHKDVLRSIYFTLINNNTFKNFGHYKVIIVSAIIDEQEFNYHHNVLITNNTTFEQYYAKVKDSIATHFNDGYKIDIVNSFKIIVWNMDNLANKKIKMTSSTVKNYTPGFQCSKTSRVTRKFHTCITHNTFSRTHFTPIPNKIIETVNNFATMDIETIEYGRTPLKTGQIPGAISLCLPSPYGFRGDPKIFLLKPDINNMERAINILFKDVFTYLINNWQGVIFVHNLGSFDGFFIYKYLSNYASTSNIPDKVNTIIDDKNKFIQISYDNIIIWKDSYRIFPVSLEDLCINFGVAGKLSKYNPNFNHLDLFNNSSLLKEFIDYSIQDSLSLFEALTIAQKIYLEKYNVDITTIYSTSTLSLKIYRSNFQDVNIK
jgi:hypothetical protein